MQLITRNRIPQETVKAVLVKYGIPMIPALASRPDYIPQIAADLGLVS